MKLPWKLPTDHFPVFLHALGIMSTLGRNKSETVHRLLHSNIQWAELHSQQTTHGAILSPLPTFPESWQQWNSRNNQVLWQLLQQIQPEVEHAISRYGANRIGVVLGSSTSGMKEAEEAIIHFRQQGIWPDRFAYPQQEPGSPALFLSQALDLHAPAYVVTTACSSSAKVFASARRLLKSRVCDAVLVGGVDTLCRFTAAGFQSLESVTPSPPCNPFSRNRQGIHIGEGGALFLLSREPAPIALLGIGESSDAYHVSAPDPSGQGAALAVKQALQEANLTASAIDYVNLHGTATKLNDAMESTLFHRLYGTVPCSSTKALTGHTLGAAGAVETALLWLTLHPQWNPQALLPAHLWDGEADPALPVLPWVIAGDSLSGRSVKTMVSHSFAFGGSNCALLLGGLP
ncbi:beta-ketoacyl-[acyl-carrier-protein] synthase family protein [Candidatus Magnetaquicoccus inordinatus]|uniref:beta-ketoacyl-[acyl-carrier-protein] synthase family protein n=1 Tax=Candidatus Magnetaquicoccus inordinatus TaxID=2496818 RepID=UPI00102C7A87|nr:beta-ketoacyl-[acyl-carrier-protein] synthase family protein [Candidatus Magnetaquicoccus inordinatus]